MFVAFKSYFQKKKEKKELRYLSMFFKRKVILKACSTGQISQILLFVLFICFSGSRHILPAKFVRRHAADIHCG